MADWKDILSDNKETLTDEDLLRYLHDHLSEEEKNLFEKKTTGAFESDALDGLQQVKDKNRLGAHVHQLNKKLPQLLRHKKHLSEKKRLPDFEWIILAIIILLFICILTYVIIVKTHG